MSVFYSLSEDCTERKSRKNKVKSFTAEVRSALPIISRMLCIDSCGIPRSTARIPVFVDSLLQIDANRLLFIQATVMKLWMKIATANYKVKTQKGKKMREVM